MPGSFGASLRFILKALVGIKGGWGNKHLMHFKKKGLKGFSTAGISVTLKVPTIGSEGAILLFREWWVWYGSKLWTPKTPSNEH